MTPPISLPVKGIIHRLSRLAREALQCVLMLSAVFLLSPSLTHAAEEPAPTSDGSQVMQGFVEQEDAQRKASEISTKERHQILFIMGVTLLILLFITGGLGITMAVTGKSLFLPHMIFAGLSMTLALAHSIVAVVWFFPF